MGNKTLSMLGIAAKSGNVASGEFAAEKMVKTGRAHLVVVSAEASENTKKKFTNMTDFYDVPLCLFGTKEELGKAIGKDYRAVLAVTDENLANAVREKMRNESDRMESLSGCKIVEE